MVVVRGAVQAMITPGLAGITILITGVSRFYDLYAVAYTAIRTIHMSHTGDIHHQQRNNHTECKQIFHDRKYIS